VTGDGETSRRGLDERDADDVRGTLNVVEVADDLQHEVVAVVVVGRADGKQVAADQVRRPHRVGAVPGRGSREHASQRQRSVRLRVIEAPVDSARPDDHAPVVEEPRVFGQCLARDRSPDGQNAPEPRLCRHHRGLRSADCIGTKARAEWWQEGERRDGECHDTRERQCPEQAWAQAEA
jgi:hypothetical protein